MKNGILKGLTFSLLAVLFYGCAASDPNIETAKLAMQSGDLDKALEATETAITTNQGYSPEGYYYKAQVLEDLAKKQSVENREDYYNRMVVAIDSASAQYQRADGSGKELLVDQFRRSTLGSEYSAGVQIYNGRDSLDAKALVKGGYHFLNSTYIYPDSSNYYYLASDLFYLGGQEDRSMELIKSGLDVDKNPDPYPYQRLATLYTARGETDKSMAILEEGIERVDEDINLIQLLADAYITGGKTQEALDLLEDLISRDPENPTYHLVYGSQVYNSVVDLVNELETTYENLDSIDEDADAQTEEELKTEAQDLVDQISTLTDTAIDELKLAIKYEEQKEEPNYNGLVQSYFVLGKVYTNKAAILIIRSNYERDIDKSNELRAEASEIYEKALDPLEAGIEIDGENTNLWNQLFQVYTRLGMNDKAAEAMEKAGI